MSGILLNIATDWARFAPCSAMLEIHTHAREVVTVLRRRFLFVVITAHPYTALLFLLAISTHNAPRSLERQYGQKQNEEDSFHHELHCIERKRTSQNAPTGFFQSLAFVILKTLST